MKIGVSAGDVNGIGLEIFFRLLPEFKNELVLYCNSRTLNEYSEHCSFEIDHSAYELVDLPYYSEVDLGKIKYDSGKHSIISIEKAFEDVIDSKNAALVTLPINKDSVYKAGWNFPGHTEFFASKFPDHEFNMILAYKDLRVIPITIHTPLRRVSTNLSVDLIRSKVESFYRSIKKDFGIKEPKIAVLGLNPHAGENGSIGNEEIEIIGPAIKGFLDGIEGPFPSDGFFGFGAYKNYDGIVSMYHDQGLIPLKLLAKGNGVNFTSGLPIIRTSPDHGTAYEIAGKNIADPESLRQSIILAKQILKNRKGNDK